MTNLTTQQIREILNAQPSGNKGVLFYYTEEGTAHNLSDLRRIVELEDKQPKWISVEDRLPESNANYLCYVYKWGEYYIVEREFYRCPEYTHNHDWFDVISGDEAEGGVTHWMPLPNPPEQVK